MAVVTAAVLAVTGPLAIELLYGARYVDAAMIVPWLAVVQGIRVAKAGPAILAIASGDTRDPLYANLVRLAFVPIVMIWLGNGGDAFALVTLAILGELAAVLTSLLLLMRRGNIGIPLHHRIARHG